MPLPALLPCVSGRESAVSASCSTLIKIFDYKAFILNNPKRLVIDTFDINVSPRLENYRDKNNLVDKTRLGSVGTDGTRIVFDLKKPAIIKKAFMLPPQSTFGWRFVVDVALASEREFASKLGSDNAFSSDSAPVKVASKTHSSPVKSLRRMPRKSLFSTRVMAAGIREPSAIPAFMKKISRWLWAKS